MKQKSYLVKVWEQPYTVVIKAETKEEAQAKALKQLALDDFGEVYKVKVTNSTIQI